jgi:hypothetical protein
MKRIRELIQAGYVSHGDALQDFRKEETEKYQILIAQVAKEAFDEVIPRFHQVRGDPISPKMRWDESATSLN